MSAPARWKTFWGRAKAPHSLITACRISFLTGLAKPTHTTSTQQQYQELRCDDKKVSFTAATKVADVNAQLSRPGKEILVVFKFYISWVREALTAVGIKIDGLRDNGECKAALFKYYQAKCLCGGLAALAAGIREA